MTDFDAQLRQQLDDLRARDLYRELRRIDSPQGPRLQIEGTSVLNFSSNDYLGLANHAVLREAAARALADFGAGSGASRLICGSLAPHHDLELALAEFKGAEAALTFSSGYATAVGAIGALLDKEDVIIIDKLIHASIVDAARLCGAKLRVFGHNDIDDLEQLLRWADSRAGIQGKRRARVLIVTESVFSMDGDLAALREIVELKERFGAWLMLDEAHATGLFGENRRGLAEAFELSDRIEVQMGTLGKALGVAGGYICGSRALIELLINRARSFIFSTAPPPAMAAAATAAVRLVQSDGGEERRSLLWARVDQAKNALVKTSWKLPIVRSPIIPLHVGAEARALAVARGLRDRGIFIPAIRYPTVARDQARLRLTITAAHSAADVESLATTLAQTAGADQTPA